METLEAIHVLPFCPPSLAPLAVPPCLPPARPVLSGLPPWAFTSQLQFVDEETELRSHVTFLKEPQPR